MLVSTCSPSPDTCDWLGRHRFRRSRRCRHRSGRGARGLDRTLLGPAGRGKVDRGLVRLGLGLVVRLDQIGVALLPAGLALGELLVQVTGVEKYEGRQLDRPGRRMDLALVAGLDEHRQAAAMVEVGVGQDDGIELARVEPERHPVADRFVRAALEHPAIDQDLRTTRSR